MQPLHLSKVIGKPYLVKFDGEVVLLKKDMTLTIGDVFFVKERKKAWFIIQGKEQIDVLDQAYMITTQGNIPFDTSPEFIQSSTTSSTGFQVKTDDLVQHGLTNQQATSLILTRYQQYFDKLKHQDYAKIPFEPQVYRICENQRMEIPIDELSSFIKATKPKSFVIDSIQFDDNKSEIIYNEQQLSIMPKLKAGEEVKLHITFTNGVQTAVGELSFVVQPAKSTPKINLFSHQLKLNHLEKDNLVANIICEGFDEKTLDYTIINDPNNYFFTIINNQLLLTTEGANAILNKTLVLDEIQITVQAKDKSNSAQASIEIPIEIKHPKNTNLPITSTKKENTQPNQIDLIEPSANTEKAEDSNHLNESEKLPAENSDSLLNGEISVEKSDASSQKGEIQAICEQRTLKTNLIAAQAKKNKQVRFKIHDIKNLDIKIKEKSSNKSQLNKPEQPPREVSNILTETAKFNFDKMNNQFEHISHFIPKQDKINLTGILETVEKNNINKHLFIKNDSTGAMVLHVSSQGDGEINQTIVFDNLDVTQMASSYQLKTAHLSQTQLSQAIVKSMIENANLICK